MGFLYYKHINLPEQHTITQEDDFKSRCAGILNTIIMNHNSYGLNKTKTTFIYIGKENGVFYAKSCVRGAKGRFLNFDAGCSTYYEDYLYLYINSYIESVNKGIVLFITDNNMKGDFKIKRKPEILL